MDFKVKGYPVRFEAVSGDDERMPAIDPSSLSPDEMATLIDGVQSGDIIGLHFRAVVFGDVPNENGVRPEPGRLGELAEQARSIRPYLDAHTGATVGQVIGGEVIDSRGFDELALDHRVTDPGEMLAVIRGLRRSFSIALRSDGFACSECGAQASLSIFGAFQTCDCEDAEVFMTGGLRLIHNAYADDPAYLDARLDNSCRQAAASFSVVPLKVATQKQEAEMPKDHASEIERLKAELASREERLATFEKTQREQAAALEEERAARKALEDARFERAFKDALKRKAVDSSERAAFETMREKVDLDFAIDQLKARRSPEVAPTTPIGHSEETSAPAPDKYAFARLAVAEGFVDRRVADDYLTTRRFVRHPALQQKD